MIAGQSVGACKPENVDSSFSGRVFFKSFEGQLRVIGLSLETNNLLGVVYLFIRNVSMLR